jgi:hypothetical protein
VLFANKIVFRKISGFHGGEYEVKVFWDVAPCSHVEVGDVSAVRTASKIRAMNYR